MGFYSDPLIHVWNARFYCYLPHFCFRAYVCHAGIAHVGILGEQKCHCAMEQWRNSQVVSGSKGCAHHQIHEGIMDTWEEKMSVTLEQARLLIFPHKREPHPKPCAGSGDRGHLHKAGMSPHRGTGGWAAEDGSKDREPGPPHGAQGQGWQLGWARSPGQQEWEQPRLGMAGRSQGRAGGGAQGQVQCSARAAGHTGWKLPPLLCPVALESRRNRAAKG